METIAVTQFTDETLIPPIDSLDDLIKHLTDVFQSDQVNVEYVKAVLAAYKSNPRDWTKYANFAKDRYTRNLVDVGNGKYNLIALCWGEGQSSSVHDHSDSHCFVKMLDGQLKETLFEMPTSEGEPAKVRADGNGLIEKRVQFCGKNDVTYINDSIGLHRVENPSHSDPAVSLHLYSPPFNFCRTFDQTTGVVQKAQMTFWSKFGKLVPADESTSSVTVSSSRAAATLPATLKVNVSDAQPSRHRRRRRHDLVAEDDATVTDTLVTGKRKRRDFTNNDTEAV